MASTNPFQRVTQERLRSLERRYSRLLWIGAFVVLFVVWRGLVLEETVGVQRFETLRADRFELLDAEARVRGIWQVVNQQPTFILQTEDGSWRAVLRLLDDGAEIDLAGPGEATRTILSTTSEGGRLRLVFPDDDVALDLRELVDTHANRAGGEDD